MFQQKYFEYTEMERHKQPLGGGTAPLAPAATTLHHKWYTGIVDLSASSRARSKEQTFQYCKANVN